MPNLEDTKYNINFPTTILQIEMASIFTHSNSENLSVSAHVAKKEDWQKVDPYASKWIQISNRLSTN